MPVDHSNDGYNYSSLPLWDRIVITQVGDNQTSSRVMTGNAVGGYFADGTTYETTLAQLSAVAYLKGVEVSPQPDFKWYSSNPDVCAVDDNGNCTRITNPNASSYDSDVCVSTGQLGGSSQIRAIALRADGSESGVEGIFNVAVQDHAFRQFGGVGSMKASASLAGTPNAYSLVESSQPPSDQS